MQSGIDSHAGAWSSTKPHPARTALTVPSAEEEGTSLQTSVWIQFQTSDAMVACSPAGTHKSLSMCTQLITKTSQVQFGFLGGSIAIRSHSHCCIFNADPFLCLGMTRRLRAYLQHAWPSRQQQQSVQSYRISKRADSPGNSALAGLGTEPDLPIASLFSRTLG